MTGRRIVGYLISLMFFIMACAVLQALLEVGVFVAIAFCVALVINDTGDFVKDSWMQE